MTEHPNPVRRRRVIAVMMMALLLGAAAITLWYFRQAQWLETTENAYLTGNMVQLSAEIGGTIVGIAVEENDKVAVGDPLLRLADGDAVQALDARKHELALAVRDVEALQSRVAGLHSETQLRAVTHQLALEEYQRRQRLNKRQMVSTEELDAARTRERETAGALETAQHALREAETRLGTTPVETHPMVLAAESGLRAAYRDWRKTLIVSPVNGQIARRRVQVGQRIDAGAPLFSIAERESAWVEANFKENQLRNMRPGQAVTMQTDLYGDDWLLHGHVASIGAGTGAIFAVLPPQNATGNWIKIVQRVPVRIEFDTAQTQERPLPFGASLEVRVDTHQRSGPRLAAGASARQMPRSGVYDYQDEGVEELIAGIIAANRQRGGTG